MSSRSVGRVAPWFVCSFVVSTVVACKLGDEPAAPAPTVTMPTIPVPPGTRPAPSAAPGAASASTRVVDQTPLATTMTIEFLDRQLFHAASRNRVIRDIRDPEKTRRFTGANFGVGLILAARNDSDRLLDVPRVISDVVIHGAHGDAKCRTEVNRYGYPVIGVVSPNVDPRTAWGDESRSFNESPWRPGETIRIAVGLDCGSVHLQDLDVQGMSGPVRVVARAFFVANQEPCPYPNSYVCDNDVVGTSAPLDLPARAIVLQQVQLPGGTSGYSAGDLFVRSDGGRVLHENLGTYLTSAFVATGSDLPAQPQLGGETVDEWSMRLGGVTIRAWHEVPGTPKGQRIVTVTADLAIDGGAIQGRLAALSDPETAAGEVEGERSRLASLLACDAVELVTQSRRVRSTNGRDVKTLCSTLVTEDRAQVSWTFPIDRYELPLGIAYTIDRAPRVTFFASASLATFDPR